jgi:sortase A
VDRRIPADPWSPPLGEIHVRLLRRPYRVYSTAPARLAFRPHPGAVPVDVMEPRTAEPPGSSVEAQPHADHWFSVKILGWVLLIGGLGVAGYYGWQLWGTGLAASAAQQELAVGFEERQAAAEPTTTLTTIPATTTFPPTTAAGAGEAVYIPEVDDTPDSPDDPVLYGEVSVEVVEAPGFIEEERPEEGEALGRIKIPVIGVDWVMVEGVRTEDLAQGPGHGPWTPVPGQAGNAVVSGHRTTYGAPFNRIDELLPGDLIVVETLIGEHVYQVVGTRVVLPTEMWVTDQWEGAWLTLTTCHPEFSARERFIVFAKLVGGPNYEAAQAAFPGPYELPEPPDA